jgi:hypothetical protein
MALTATIVAQLDATLTKVTGLANAAATHPVRKAISFADGAAAGQASKLYTAAAQSIAASGTASHDLSGALVDGVGVAAVFTKVKAILVVAAATNVNDVVVGGDANAVLIFSTAASTHAVKPGGVLLMVAPDANGWPVTAATGDILKIANSAAGTAVVYDLAVLGA